MLTTLPGGQFVYLPDDEQTRRRPGWRVALVLLVMLGGAGAALWLVLPYGEVTDAVSEREAAPVPVRQAPRHREAVGQGVRDEAGPEGGEEDQPGPAQEVRRWDLPRSN